MMTSTALRQLGAVSIAAALALAGGQASACTSFNLKARNGDVVYGRTLEFALPLNSDLIVIPRHLTIEGVGPDGKAGTGLTYTTKYGAAGANGLGLPVLVDGIYQIKTYGNSDIRQISLGAADLDAKAIRFIPLDQKPVVTDLSKP